MSGSRAGSGGVQNGQDVSGMEFADDAWDSNDMLRGDGEDVPEPLEDDGPEDDDVEGDGGSEIIEPDDEDVELETSDDEGPDEDYPDGDSEAEGDEEDIEPVEPIEPPANWPEQERQFFAELPPELQHAYLNRARHMVADYTRKTQALSQERQYYGQLNQIISPRVQGWALQGMSPVAAIHQVLALSDYAAQDPVGFAQHLCRLRGVDLVGELTKNQQDPNEYVDPQVQTLRNEFARVQAQLNQTAQQTQQREQQQQVQQYQNAFRQTVGMIDQFAKATDQNGNLLYPHFNELEEDIAIEIESGRARNVPEAYQTAVWANASTRAKMLARSRSAENAKARKAAQRAQRAAASVGGVRGGNGALNTDKMSIGDTLRAAYRGDLG